ncbi:MAG: hypothetical protein ACKVY0_22405, partial [Prosthecobacter sp.]|uniref:hypothetical protein n=1 Tax=Prosthecobacter sp. TaxID=1965333 RepID=UPI0038FFADF2
EHLNSRRLDGRTWSNFQTVSLSAKRLAVKDEVWPRIFYRPFFFADPNRIETRQVIQKRQRLNGTPETSPMAHLGRYFPADSENPPMECCGSESAGFLNLWETLRVRVFP